MEKEQDLRQLKLQKILPVVFVYAVMILLAVIINCVSTGFLTVDHIYSILKQAAFLGIVCVGQSLVILTGGIDLSLEYTLLFSNVLAAAIISGQNENTFTALAAVIGVAVLIGLLNGCGVYFLKIPAMIMTLSTGTAVYGLAYIYCNGAPGGFTSDILNQLSNGRFGGIFSGVTIVWIILAAAVIVILRSTVLGRSIYAIGTNRGSADYSGIQVRNVTLIVYIIASVMAAITGYFLLGYTGTSYMSTGSGYNMDSIAAVVIGGTSIAGGSGGYVGTIAGVCIMVLINSLLTILHMPEAVKQIVQGLLIAVLLLVVSGRKKER